MSDKQIPLQKHLNIVSDLKLKLDEARRERDEALELAESRLAVLNALVDEGKRACAKALEEAAAMLAPILDRIGKNPALYYGTTQTADFYQEIRAAKAAILALREKP